ncbi:MAG: hypothetical protein HY238_09640 [Acidobacteria bacterium]|nr:hypothetical protein [Acidobacteriota bacterium]
MATMNKPSVESILGRSPEELSLEERTAFAGSWIALEIYSPKTTPLRRIEAIGDSMEECIALLRRRGLEPTKFELSRLKPPY